jgi:MFS family permease
MNSMYLSKDIRDCKERTAAIVVAALAVLYVFEIPLAFSLIPAWCYTLNPHPGRRNAQIVSEPRSTDNVAESTRSTLLSLYLPAFILALGTGIALPAVPVYAKSFDVGFGVASLVIVMHLAGRALSSIPTGFIIDRFGRRVVILAGPILTALASFLMATAGSFNELLIYRFLGGWAIGMWTMGRVTMVADSGGSSRGRQITAMFSMDNAGNLVGPVIGGFVASIWDIRMPFIVHGVLALLAIIPSFKIIRELPTQLAGSKKRNADEPSQAGQPVWRQFLVFNILILFVSYLFVSLTRGTLAGGALNVYAVYQYDIDAATVGGMAALVAAVGIPVTISAGHIMDRFGRKATIVPGFAALSVAMVVMAIVAWLNLPFAVFVAALVAVSLTQSYTGGSMQTLASDIAPANARGKFFGLWNLTGQGATFISPAAFGFMGDAFGAPAAFAFLAFTSLMASSLVGFCVTETVKKREAAPVTA